MPNPENRPQQKVARRSIIRTATGKARIEKPVSPAHEGSGRHAQKRPSAMLRPELRTAISAANPKAPLSSRSAIAGCRGVISDLLRGHWLSPSVPRAQNGGAHPG